MGIKPPPPLWTTAIDPQYTPNTTTRSIHSFAWKRKKAEQQAMCGLDETGRPLRALGGKRDDITVVVARVVMG